MLCRFTTAGHFFGVEQERDGERRLARCTVRTDGVALNVVLRRIAARSPPPTFTHRSREPCAPGKRGGKRRKRGGKRRRQTVDRATGLAGELWRITPCMQLTVADSTVHCWSPPACGVQLQERPCWHTALSTCIISA